jgi:hypothetical protein
MLPITNLSSLGQQYAAPQLGGSQQPSAVSNLSQFATTGVPSLDGQSYAYMPGSSMAMFMDDLNNRVGLAARGPDGTDVMTWANGLALQAEQRRQQQQALLAQQLEAANAGAQSGGIDPNNPMQMLQMLLSMLMSQLQGSLAS